MSTRRAVILVVVLFVLLPAAALAQTVTGTLQGTVTDKSGAALPGVSISVRNLETGLERTLVTDERGFYNAPYLPIGRYRVAADLSGMGSMARQNVPIELNHTTVQDFVLAPAVSETITVQAEAPRVNTTDGEIKQTLREGEIELLPMPDQTNVNRLATLFAGYQENPTSGQDNPALSSGSSVNFNGTGTRGATFQINGVNNDDASENQNRQNVPAATIKSFQILTNSFSAEFGRGYGSVVLVQTKQGTNDINGEVYAYAQDNKYISRDVLQVSLSHGNAYRRQFGATSGFPIFKDRLFAFVSADQTQKRGSVFETRGVFLPTDLDPAKRLTLGNDTPANRAWQDSIIARFPKASPNAPAIAARAYQAFKQQNIPSRDWSVRLDMNATASNVFTARYQRSAQEENLGELIVGEIAAKDNRQSNFGLTWTGILSSNTVQEARLGLGIRHTQWAPIDPKTPVVRIAATGVPVFTILGNAGAFPIIRDQRDTQLVYNISTSRWMRHTLKAGVDLRRGELDDRADNFNRGFWSFGATCGGVNYGTGIAAFWAGCVSSFTISYGPNYLEHRINEQNAYVQDDWRIRDNLVLNLGARYERVEPPKEQQNLVDYRYDTTQYLDPRLGFAYTPNWDGNRFLRAVTGGNGRFAIRGGFGIFHGRVFQSSFSQGGASVRYNPPNAATLGFTSTNLADPTNGFVFVPGQSTTRVAATFVDPDLKMPESRQWNLTFERQTFWNSRLRATYIGTLGKNLLFYRFTNAPVMPAPPGTAGAQWVVAQDWRCAGTGSSAAIPVNATCPVAVPIAPNEVSLRVPRLNERRPDARYTDVRVVSNGTSSSYHAGQLEWELGDYRGFGGRATYTFGKALDYGSEATFVGTGDVNGFPDREGSQQYARGPSRFDTRHRFTFAASYRLPWLKDAQGVTGALFGGWTLSTLLRMSSGTPYTISDSGAPDFLFLGATTAPLRPVCVKPEYCGGWHVNSRNKKPIPRDAFRHPQYGDKLTDLIGRNSYYTDGAETLDAGLYKTFRLPANLAVMIRVDAFNVLNRTTWWYPVTDMNSANFGTLNQTAYSATVAGAPSPLSPPRTFQLGLRIMY